MQTSRVRRFLAHTGVPLVAIVMLAACGGGTTAPSLPPSFAAYSSPHFVIRYVGIDEAAIAAAAAAIEAEYGRILADLGVASMPVVTVTLYPDRDSFVAAVGSRAGYIPQFATGLVTGVDEIHLVPGGTAVASRIIHEFAHCVSIRANPSIPNNPRWLWETIAIYESEEAPRAQGITVVTGPAPPALARLNAIDDTTIYDVGFLLGDFIVTTFGRPALRDLLAHNGDIAAVLGMAEAVFEEQWVAFVRRRYLP